MTRPQGILRAVAKCVARLATVKIIALVLALSCAMPFAGRAASPDSAMAVASAAIPSPATPLLAAAPSPAPRLGGYLQAREIAQEHAGLTAVLNRVRFSMDGSLPAGFAGWRGEQTSSSPRIAYDCCSSCRGG